MDINELESYRLSDAIKFNQELNPRLWGSNQHLRLDVRDHLLKIADDFREFLGVDDLSLKDITLSGSNAAYTYTPHSDIDLHLVVDIPDDPVYQELFNAKKYQYNDEYNFKIGPYDIELYVQDSKQPHVSQGIYSIRDNKWLSVPKRSQPSINDISVKSKYEDLGHKVDSAIDSGNLDSMDQVADKIKDMRKAGLADTGEFSPENLAFKVLRNNGTLDRLTAARQEAKSQSLSLKERKKPKFVYGNFGPLNMLDTGGDGEGGGESIAEAQQPRDIKEILQPFINSCMEYLGIERAPRIIIKKDPEWTRKHGTFGQFDTDTYSVTLAVSNRHPLDILRTLAHELTHARQDELATMPVDAGETGSPYEDEANAMAGRIMRHWVDQYPEFFKDIPLEESVKDRLAAVAAAACIAGTPGCATTGDAVRGVQAAGTAAQTIKRMGRAGAEEEMMQRLKNELRRRQGQVVPESTTDEDNQSIDEAQISKNIQPILVKKGYAFLGKGQDQDAYLAPDGTVLKIFGYGPGGKLSQGQQSFKDFADYCMAKPNNPFLPQFGGWEPFDFEGKRYLQIKSERMFDLSKSGLIIVGARLGQLASLIQSNGADRGVNKFLRRHKDEETGKLVSLVGGRQQFLLLATTIEQLAKLANQKGYRLDLHGGNFMIGSDGEIVINDPFFTGTWRFDESINESLDQPYKILRWEKGDYGDVDAIARLDDGTFLSVMFNKGFSQDTKEEAWSVEFYRNNSQEKTGEGDQQRVFATVLSAVQTFISDRVPGAKGKYKPNKVYFSASKEVKPDEDQRKAMTRARLYDSLVQRYARALGFRAFRADTGNKVMYELSRIKPVTEGTENNLSTIIQSFVNSSSGQKYKQYDCKTVTRAFVQWAEQNKIPTQVVSLAPPSADFIAKNPRYKGKSGQGDGHIMPIVNGNAIDFTVRQFGINRPFENPLITPTNSLPAVYGKFGYFTDKPEWFLGGKSHWIGLLNSIPSEIFNQNFGDELLEHTMAENLEEGVNDNYLYHATMPAGMMRILRTGSIKATDRPQPSTKARTQYPTISTTRSKQYAESDQFVDFLNLTNDGNAVILVFDRNAVANHYKMFGTSQGTQTVGDEYEEVIVVPRGSMPIRGTLKGFYFNPNRTAEIQEYQDVPWFKELLASPYYMGKKLNEATGFIPVNSKLAHDPRYVSGLTVDIKPGETQRQAKKLGWAIDDNGSPPLLMAKLENQLKEIKAK